MQSHNGMNILMDAIGPELVDMQPGSPPHRCRICQRAYERADHLRRHFKSHENARPFQCQRCTKSFNRVDLLSRHVAAHERDAKSGLGRAEVRRTERVGRACMACAAAKARCEDRKPCRRCRSKKIHCETPTQLPYSQEQSRCGDASRGTSKESVPLASRSMIDPHGVSTSQTTEGNSLIEPSNATGVVLSSIHAYTTPVIEYDAAGHRVTYPQPVEPLSPLADAYDISHLQLDTSQLGSDSIMDDMLFFPNPVEFNNQNLDFGFQDFDFHDEHLKTITAVPKHITIDENVNPEKEKEMPAGGRDASRGYAAFTRSPWLWTPAPKDRILGNRDNLALDEESIPSTLTPRSFGVVPNGQGLRFPSLDAGLRDKMFYVVATMNKYASGIPKFPSLDVVNHIIEAFFVRHSHQVDTWMHVPTLSLTDAHPEFLLALVMGGSTVISVPGIWKMGLVLQDVIRVTVGELFERENSNTRKLQPLQAWMLSLDTGLWSGFQRQMEIAESFGQPMITMMRRGGILGAPPDAPTLIPTESDTGPILEAKWRKWVQRESFKRLSLHLFLHDTRASIALQKTPLISFTEISFSVPASRHLFLEGSAAEWKSRYLDQLTRSKRALPRLIDVMHDLDVLDDFRDEIDVNLCYTSLLHAFWGQIWAFRESSRFHGVGEQGDSVHRLWLLTQQRELYREIQNFKDVHLAIRNQQPEIIMTTELLLMILHVSPEELQRFAGKAGEEAASQALDALEQWSATEHARRAVWHAGQVFRWASLMRPAELRDFHTVAVYFASLTMWVYGHLSSATLRDTSERSKTVRQSYDMNNTSSLPILDGPESRETRAFISGSLGAPVLTSLSSGSICGGTEDSSATFITLSDPNMVLKMARDLYRKNFPILEEPLPPLVENIGNLMRDLSSLPESRFSRCASPAER